MTSWKHYGAGIGNAASYLVSGIPFMTGSATMASGTQDRISFPFVTKRIVVISSGTVGDSSIRVHFAPTGSARNVASNLPFVNEANSNFVNENQHFVELIDQDTSFEFHVRCKEVWISSILADSGYKLYAELTRISSNEMFEMSGSGRSDGKPGTH